MGLPLDGVRILAITQYGAGPFAMLQLADLGADIIKIENPLSAGDVARTVPPYLEEGVNDSIYFQSFNRNCRSLTLNLQSPEGLAVLHRLVKGSHGVFSNLRGDLPTKMGLRYNDLKDLNPKIVTCHLTGYGLDNGRSARPSYDPLIQAETGIMHMTGEPDGDPQRCGVSVVDFAGGFNAAFALVAGIFHAESTGRGADLDVSLFDTAISMLNYLAGWHFSRGYEASRQPDSSHPTQIPSGVVPTKDGTLMIMCAKEEFYQRLCDTMGKPEWKTDSRFLRFGDRLKNRNILMPMLKEEFRKRTTQEWLEALGTAVPCAPVNDLTTALSDPFLEERGMLVQTDHPVFGKVPGVRSAVKVNAPPSHQRMAPQLGEHTSEILSTLGGYSKEEIASLRRKGIT